MLTTPSPPVDIAALIPFLQHRRRFTVRLHPRRGHADRLASKMGGDFAWPMNKPVPTCPEHARTMTGVLQLRRQEVPELEFPARTDILQLFWCPLDFRERPYCPVPVVAWHSTEEFDDCTVISAWTESTVQRLVPKPCEISPERVAEFPPIEELSERELDAIMHDAKLLEFVQKHESELGTPDAAYEWALSVADGTKVGGYCRWVQHVEVPTCSCGTSMAHLLTVASAEYDGGTWYRWLPNEERHVWGAELKTRLASQSAADLMLGDMGYVYVFECRACDNRPSEAVLQCS